MEVCLRPDLKRGAGISWSTIVGIVARISQRGGMRGREYVNRFRHRYFVDMQNGLIAMVSGSLLTRHATEEVSSRAISRRAFAVAATAGLMAVLGDMDDGTTRANASTDSDATILLTDR